MIVVSLGTVRQSRRFSFEDLIRNVSRKLIIASFCVNNDFFYVPR